MDEDDSAMQQMMGFSAFSSGDKKRAYKKQKLSSDRNVSSTHMHASAGNATPLGIRSTSHTTGIVSQQGMDHATPPSQPQADVRPQDHAVSGGSDEKMMDKNSNYQENDNAPTLHNLTGASKLTSTSTSTTVTAPEAPTATQDNVSAKATMYSSSDIRSDPNYWNSTSTTDINTNPNKPQAGNRPLYNDNNYNASNGTNNNPRKPNTRNRDTYPDNDEIGYTNPRSGYTMTNRELNEYARGKDKVQEDGSTVKVYFKPNFLEDPWAEFY